MVTVMATDRVYPLCGSKNDEKPFVFNGITLAQGSTYTELDGDKIWVLLYNESTEMLEWKVWA